MFSTLHKNSRSPVCPTAEPFSPESPPSRNFRNGSQVKSLITIISGLSFATVSAPAIDYYVDFAEGNDANSGTSKAAPWKHAVGDANAAAVAAGVRIIPGDTIYFKGGIMYRGKIDLTAPGTPENRITYDGAPPDWGTGKAIIDGTQTLNWTRCTGEGSAPTEVQNQNYPSIYFAPLPPGSDWRIPVFEGDKWLVHSGTDAQPDPWFYNNTDYFRAMVGGVGATSTTDPSFFSQPDPTYWNGAIMMIHISGNAIGYQPITSFSPGTNSVVYSNIGVPYTDGNWDGKFHYSVINGQRQISGPGQYTVDQAGGRILVWPKSDITKVTAGKQNYGFHTNGCSYNTIRNFAIRGQDGTRYVTGRQISGSNSTPTNGLVIEQCDLSNSQDGGATAAIYTYGAGQSDNIVRNCTLTRIYGRGIFGTGNGFNFQANELSYITGTVLYSQNNSTIANRNGKYLDNYIHNCSGVHANGMTIYGGAGTASAVASDFLVARNRVIRQYHRYGPFAVSLQGHRNIQFENNVLDGGVADDGAVSGSDYIRWYNNTITKTLRIYGAANSSQCIVKNNILIGGLLNNGGELWSAIQHSNNIFVTPAWRQESQYGFTFGAGETLATLSNLFINPTAGDFRLSESSPANSAGANLSAIFTTDVMTKQRTNAWDIGAFKQEKLIPPARPTQLKVK